MSKIPNPIHESLRELEELRKSLAIQISDQQSRKLLATIFENLPMGAIIFTLPAGKIIRANPVFCRWLGYQEKDLSANLLIAHVYGPDLERTGKVLERMSTTRNRKEWLNNFANRFYSKEGEPVWLRWESGTATRLDIPGISFGFCSIITDLNEVDRLNKEFGL